MTRMQVAETLNTFFSDSVKSLDINGYQFPNKTIAKLDFIENAINKFKEHPSIIRIREKIKPNKKFDFQSTTIEQVANEMSKLNRNKPTTQNTIPAKILIENIDIFAPVITNTYNDSLNIGKFPTCLKKADMTPVHKKDDKTNKDFKDQ